MATKTPELIDQTIAFETEFFDDFEGNVQQSGFIPYCQIVSPPNLPIKQIKSQSFPYGLFITHEQAEAVEFKPDENWKEETVIYGDAEITGYLSLRVRFVILHQSGIEIQEKPLGENSFRFIGMAYEKGKLTAAGEKEKADKNNNPRTVRKVNRLLIAFLNSKNEFMHSKPLQLTARGGFGGSLGIELKEFYQQVDSTYLKAAKAAGKTVKGGSLDAEAHALAIVDGTLDIFKPEGVSPFVCLQSRLSPTVDPAMVGVSKTVKRKERDVILTGAPLSALLLRKTSTLGKQILEWRDEFSSFPLPNAGRDGETASKDVPYYGEGVVTDLQFEESGDILFNLQTEAGEQKCYARGEVGGAFANIFEDGKRFRITGLMNGKGAIVTSFSEVESADFDDDF